VVLQVLRSPASRAGDPTGSVAPGSPRDARGILLASSWSSPRSRVRCAGRCSGS